MLFSSLHPLNVKAKKLGNHSGQPFGGGATLVSAWLPPGALPHLVELERAGAWRGLSDTCKWKWDPTWKQRRQSLGAGRRGRQRKDSPILSLIYCLSLAPL